MYHVKCVINVIINNIIINVSKMCRISLHISGFDLQYTQRNSHLSN